MFKLPSTLALCAALGSALACASTQPPQQQQVASQSAIRAAEEVGAGEIPQAALHLQLAREQVAAAEKLIAHKRHERASLLLKRAEADAELALTMARTRPLEEEAKAALEALEALRSGNDL